ncbi:MAG: DUF433 domain-containing protein [Planctomycetes bacterium]|nr:DUF433 domain-containing protein [Planctomycetota bacterium]
MSETTRSIYGAKDPVELPAYGLVDAARLLRLPTATVRAWTLGQRYAKGAKLFRPVVEIADRSERMLSFRNLVELHILSAIRREYGVSLQSVRKAVDFMRKRLRTEHPLASRRMLTDGKDLLIEHGENLLNASRGGQGELKIVEACLQRIEFSKSGALQRFYPFTTTSPEHDEHSVVIDPRVQFGRPCLRDTGIPTEVVNERFLAGESPAAIAVDYGVDLTRVLDAVRFEGVVRAA